MEKDNYITIGLIMIIIAIIIASVFAIVKIYDNSNKEDKQIVEIAETETELIKESDTQENSINNSVIEEGKEQETKIEFTSPYYKNNTVPISNIENFSKTIKHQEKVGGGTTVCWYPKGWNSGGYVSNSKTKIYDIFFNMEADSKITYDEFINLAVNTIRDNTQPYWACYNEDNDNEYYTEKLDINGYEYKIIKVVSISKYSTKRKAYVYFFPLQKNNILYCLMAEIGEDDYNEETLDIVKKVFSSYYIS